MYTNTNKSPNPFSDYDAMLHYVERTHRDRRSVEELEAIDFWPDSCQDCKDMGKRARETGCIPHSYPGMNPVIYGLAIDRILVGDVIDKKIFIYTVGNGLVEEISCEDVTDSWESILLQEWNKKRQII